ncbi:hypothetical protein TNCV_1923211 [Trichonephila clavipes]|nr:hypothetical protein TNCV_1923211 [Trichonephila clavipes]
MVAALGRSRKPEEGRRQEENQLFRDEGLRKPVSARRSSTAHVASDKREKKLADGQLHSVISQRKVIVKIFVLCVTGNVYSTECQAAVNGGISSRQTTLRGYGDRAEKGRLVVSSNRS